MARPAIRIPQHDIKGIHTLVKEGLTALQISEYYCKKGIPVSEGTIYRKIKKI